MSRQGFSVILAGTLALGLGVVTDAEAGKFKIKVPKIKIQPPHIGGDVGKILRHVDKERRNGRENAVEAVQVVGKTAERQLHSTGDSLAAAAKRVGEGKYLDVPWHLGTDPMKSWERNGLRAMQESSALRMGGQVAATAYFGPVGAAAFSAYYVGRTTADLEEGLRAGAISGASSYALGEIGAQPGAGIGDVAGRAVGSGVVGGTASAASGGKFEDGALHAAAGSAFRDGYRAYAGTAPDGRSGGENISKGTATACAGHLDCHVVETADDMRELVTEYPGRTHIGVFNPDVSRAWADTPLTFEGGVISRGANIIPGMNAMAIFHDTWSLDVRMGDFTNRATIPLAIRPTYIALGANRDAALLKESVESAEERKIE